MIEVLCDDESCVYNGDGNCHRGEELTVNIVDGNCQDIETDFYTKMD